MPGMNDLLVVFVPARTGPGSLLAAFSKLGLQCVEGCGEPPVRAAFAGRRGLLLTLVGFETSPGPRGKGRVVLPAAARDALAAVGGASGGDFQFVVLAPGGEVRGEARLDFDRLGEPLAPGCCYTVAGAQVRPVVSPPVGGTGAPRPVAPGVHVDD